MHEPGTPHPWFKLSCDIVLQDGLTYDLEYGPLLHQAIL